MTESIEINRNLFSYVDETFILSPEQPIVLETSDLYPNKAAPSIEQVYLPSHRDLDIKWKSVAVVHQPSSLKLAYPSYGIEKDQQPQFKRNFSSSSKSNSFKDNKYFIGAYGAVCDIYGYPGPVDEKRAPEKPIVLMATHFETPIQSNCIAPLIERALQVFPEVSYESRPEDFMWNAVYFRGSIHSKFQVNVYSNGDRHIIEANRLMGDCPAFRTVWDEIKAAMQHDSDESTFVCEPSGVAAPLPAVDLLSDEEAIKILQPILKMAKSGQLESQLESAKIFCDLSLHDSMQQLLCDSGCIQTLVVDLMRNESCEWTSHHAIFALANLSEAQCCQDAMIDAGILPALLAFAKDAPYNKAERSREAARILANISACAANRVVSALGPRTVSNWLDSVDSMTDDRLRLHAIRARDALAVVFAN